MDLTDVVNDLDEAEHFNVLRSTGGQYDSTGWREKYNTLPYYGIISEADAKTVDALPEADRVHEAIVINCELPLYVTRADGSDSPAAAGPATSDIVQARGQLFRVIKTYNYQSRGYWWAVAVRMGGN